MEAEEDEVSWMKELLVKNRTGLVVRGELGLSILLRNSEKRGIILDEE
jgi:hypothetical protein